MSDDTARREFLKRIGAVGATLATGTAAGEAEAAAPQARPQTGQPPPQPIAYTFFTPPEAAFVEAVANQFIPADELTPNGVDCGIPVFIDRQLAGGFGTGDRMYMQGPWATGTPSQGYQLPMTPAEFFRAGAAATAKYCADTFHKDFDRLTAAEQQTVLKGLESGTIVLKGVPTQQFFQLLLDLTTQGFFADPVYGGNRNKASWKMLGFPGAVAIYSEHIKNYRNRKYDGEPTSIADLS